jgi:hypothetical protein
MNPDTFNKGFPTKIRVLLKIGPSACFIAKDATSAARVVDALTEMQPVREIRYTAPTGQAKTALIGDHSAALHSATISPLTGYEQFANEADFDASADRVSASPEQPDAIPSMTSPQN